MTIRIAEPQDAEELLSIYAPYVEHTAITFEYEVPEVEEFRSRIIHTLERYPYLVAEEEGEILGYAYASAFHARPAYDWSVETSIYVRRDLRGKHIGSRLYDALEYALSVQNVSNSYACIAYARPDNTHLDNRSMYFHEHRGYALVGQFHQCGYKFSEWYDMIYMEKMLNPHPSDAEDFIPFSLLPASAVLGESTSFPEPEERT